MSFSINEPPLPSLIPFYIHAQLCGLWAYSGLILELLLISCRCCFFFPIKLHLLAGFLSQMKKDENGMSMLSVAGLAGVPLLQGEVNLADVVPAVLPLSLLKVT